MFKKDYIPGWLLLFYIAGILVGNTFTFDIALVFVLIVALFTAYYLSIRFTGHRLIPSVWPAVFGFSVFFLLGISSVYLHTETNRPQHYTQMANENGFHVFEVKSVLKPGAYSQNYIGEVLRSNNRPVSGKVLIRFYNDSLKKAPVLQPGTRFIGKGNIKPVALPKNPYGFNYRNYLEKKQVYAAVTLHPEKLVFLKRAKPELSHIAYGFREKIIRKLSEYSFTEDEMAIVKALLLGDRTGISNDLIENYKNAGAVHILAVSGLHIGIILLMLNFIFKPLEWLPYGKPLKLAFVLLFLWGFAFIAGMSASVVRAVSLFSAVAIGTSLRKSVALGDMLILSAFLILLFNPFFLFDVGFQLSYSAVISIISFQPLMAKWWQPKNKVLFYFWQLFCVSIAAQLGVLPLSLYYFHQFPGLFFISSLAIIPVLGVVLFGGFLIILLSVIGILPNILASFYASVIDMMNRVVAWVGSIESFIFRDIPFTGIMAVLLFGALIAFWFVLTRKNSLAVQALLIFVIAFQSVLIYQKYKRATVREWIVFNVRGKTLTGIRNGNRLQLLGSDSLATEMPFIRDYRVATMVQITKKTHTGSRFLPLNEKLVFHLNSGKVYLNGVHPDILLLSGNPKVHFERLLSEMKPKQVIADQSNYTSYAKRWEKTCLKFDIPFYNTPQKGAFRMSY